MRRVTIDEKEYKLKESQINLLTVLAWTCMPGYLLIENIPLAVAQQRTKDIKSLARRNIVQNTITYGYWTLTELGRKVVTALGIPIYVEPYDEAEDIAENSSAFDNFDDFDDLE